MRSHQRLFLPIGLIALLSAGARIPAAYLPGDVNGDTLVDGKDTTMVLQAALGMTRLTGDALDAADCWPSPGAGPKAGQAHGDGVIDVRDVVAQLQVRLNPPSTIAPTYANIQHEVFDKSCAFSSCHGAQGQRGGMILDDAHAYDNLVRVACTVDQGQPHPRLRVDPGHPEASMLFIKLTRPGPNDGAQMPLGTENGLDPSKVELIRQWILKGAPKDGDLTPPAGNTGNTWLPIDPNYDASGDVQLAPPPPGEGLQMEIAPFPVPVGTEVQRNYYYKLPSDQDIDIAKVEFAFNPGSHHLNIFKSDTDDLPDGYYEQTFDATVWERWYLVVDAQNSSIGWQLPPGVAIHLNAHQQLLLQTHYVNTDQQQTPTGHGKVLINFWFAKPGTVQYHMGAMFAQNRQISLPPHAFSQFTKNVTFPQDVHILAMTGHFHGRGVQFLVDKWDGTNVGDEIYRSQAWGDPPFEIYGQPIDIKAGQGLSYTCYYYNNTDRVIKFGPHVDTEEHANLFVFFYPGLPDDKALYAF